MTLMNGDPNDVSAVRFFFQGASSTRTIPYSSGQCSCVGTA